MPLEEHFGEPAADELTLEWPEKDALLPDHANRSDTKKHRQKSWQSPAMHDANSHCQMDLVSKSVG